MGSILNLDRLKKVFNLFTSTEKGLSSEEIKKYLPKYLSKESYKKLLKELDRFPNNSEESYYTTYLNDHTSCYQGDALDKMPFALLPKNEIKEVPVMILSNSCDMNPDNDTPYNDTLAYAPIQKLSKYLNMLDEDLNYSDEQIGTYKNLIIDQNISSIFFLPGFQNIDDSIVRLDYISSCHISHIDEDNIPNKRLFSLSNVGFYLFLFKLSVHFTRIREAVDRNKGIVK